MTIYNLLNKDYEIVMKLSKKEIEEKFNIKNIDKFLISKSTINEYIVVEEEKEHESFKKFYENERYLYYCTDKGNIIRVNKKTRKRLILKKHIDKGYLLVRIDKKQRFVSHIIADSFLTKLPSNYVVIHKDGNKINCSLDNIKILSKQEYASLQNKLFVKRKEKCINKRNKNY